MENRKGWRKYWYLLVASGAILSATFALLIMQHRAINRAEEQTQRTIEANLDMRLLELTDEAKRDTLDHANHIMHGIRQQRIRERNIPSIERAFTRTLRRYPETENFYVVFFDPKTENENWQALKFVKPDANDPNVKRYEGTPVGSLVEDSETSRSLKRAWDSVKKEAQTTLYTAFDPQTAESNEPRQYFFHTVYELDRLKRENDLESVGLIVFSANPQNFPAKNYLEKLVARHRSDKQFDDLLGNLNYKISLTGAGSERDLLKIGETSGSFRTRSFAAADNLFPNLVFALSSPAVENKTYLNEYSGISILLGIAAAILSLVGLGLTWRATSREMKVAQLKSDFLANISHELKTPLTAIRAFGDLLHSERVRQPERIREYGGIIKTESDRLTKIINNILEMSRLERGVRSYRFEENDLASMVTETIEMFRHSTEAADFEIKTNFPAHPVETVFDENAIRQALINLLSNAAKYSENNKIIEVALTAEQHQSIIEVKDYGVGITAAEQKNIFTAFHRTSQNEIQQIGGAGLGLAIVREIVKAHGGEITVESELGAGSVFKIILPNTLAIETIKEADGAHSDYRRRAKRGYRFAR